MENIETILKKYEALKLNEVIDFAKFNEYAIVHHSSAIEGSTLTETDTQLLLDEGVTPKGKPLEHSLMVKDHYEALKFVLNHNQASEVTQKLTVEFIQKINALVMKSTGSIKNTVFGSIDERNGDFRKGNVSAGGSYFVNYDKVVPYTNELVKNINEQLATVKGLVNQFELSFSAHFDLVSIHPFYDGNGRTSRLLMNYIQAIFNLPLSIVYKEDRAEYIQALKDSRSGNKINPFINFMFTQLEKQLTTEINLYNSKIEIKPNHKKGLGYSMFF